MVRVHELKKIVKFLHCTWPDYKDVIYKPLINEGLCSTNFTAQNISKRKEVVDGSNKGLGRADEELDALFKNIHLRRKISKWAICC